MTDTEGNIIRKLTGPVSKGINRIAWDLRYPLPRLAPPPPPESDEEPEAGPFVMPGKYRITLEKRVDGVVTRLAQPREFNVVVPGQASMPVADRRDLAEFQQKVAHLQRVVYGANQIVNELKTRMGSIKKALQATPASVDSLMPIAMAIEVKVNDLSRDLQGDATLRSRNENDSPSINERVSKIADDEQLSTWKPTQTNRDGFELASQDFKNLLGKLKALIQTDLANLEKQMEAAGAPWTPGRLPTWQDE